LVAQNAKKTLLRRTRTSLYREEIKEKKKKKNPPSQTVGGKERFWPLIRERESAEEA